MSAPYVTSERGEAWILICGLPEVEYQIAKRIIERLAMGLRQYGPWPADDRRDMREEAMQEVLDAAIYSARALTRGEIPDDDKRGCEGCP